MPMFQLERSLTLAEYFFLFSLAGTLSVGVGVAGWKLVEFAFDSARLGYAVGMIVFVLAMLMVRYILRGLADTATS